MAKTTWTKMIKRSARWKVLNGWWNPSNRNSRMIRSSLNKGIPMAYNEFTGNRIMDTQNGFQTPSEKAMKLLMENRSKVELFIGTDISNMEIMLWGDEAGSLSNIVAHNSGSAAVRKFRSFEKELVKNVQVIEDQESSLISSIIMSRNPGGMHTSYDRSMVGDVINLKIDNNDVVKLSITAPPGPAADWVECFTYLVSTKENIKNIAQFLHDLYANHNKNPVFHTFGARGANDDVEIENYSWDRVVLDPTVLKMLKSDFESFFLREDWFKAKQLPFRRGYLLHGDPGNGKTSAIKAMMWAKGIDAYTLSFFDKNVGLAELNAVFETASERKPSLVVLEDIDRAFPKSGSKCAISIQELLNAIDGIGTKEGIIVIATANNPADLDAAILKRPGRFDRTIKFDNPSYALRQKYFLSKDPLLVTDSNFESALVESDGYSFAQLQEAYILAGQYAYEEEMTDINGDQILRAVRTLASSNKGVKKNNTVGF